MEREGEIFMALGGEGEQFLQPHKPFCGPFPTPRPLKIEHLFIMPQVYTGKCTQCLAKELSSVCSLQGPYRHLTFLETWHLLNRPLSTLHTQRAVAVLLCRTQVSAGAFQNQHRFS